MPDFLLSDILALSARAVAARVAGGDVSAEAVARAYLDRIAARDAAIEAWVSIDREPVLAAARARDGAGTGGMLAGVPVGVKDVIDTADLPTGYGSALYAGHRPAADASCVALARGAGAVVLGKTVATEFAMASPGKTRNPWNPGHTPGGSSSGSCAAVASGMALMAFGTQTVGSITRPAAYCGVVGYKPSFGLLPRAGVKPLADTLDTLGIITRDVRDAAYCTAALAGRSALVVPEDPRPPRIGIFPTSRWALAEAPAREAMSRTQAAAEAAGYALRDLSVPGWFDGLFALQDAILGWEVAQSLAHERLACADRVAPATRAFFETRIRTTADEYDAALAVLAGIRPLVDDLFEDVDVLLTPAATGEAPEGLESTGNAVFNRAWTLLHLPCITVPVGLGPRGLPVGVQLVGRLGQDARLLAAAAQVEDALDAQGTRSGRALWID
jgi:Asp-tRNA(Asn)/Glu-tRNA(Gln) amidotransferase A subunit family amidase